MVEIITPSTRRTLPASAPPGAGRRPLPPASTRHSASTHCSPGTRRAPAATAKNAWPPPLPKFFAILVLLVAVGVLDSACLAMTVDLLHNRRPPQLVIATPPLGKDCLALRVDLRHLTARARGHVNKRRQSDCVDASLGAMMASLEMPAFGFHPVRTTMLPSACAAVGFLRLHLEEVVHRRRPPQGCRKLGRLGRA